MLMSCRRSNAISSHSFISSGKKIDYGIRHQKTGEMRQRLDEVTRSRRRRATLEGSAVPR